MPGGGRPPKKGLVGVILTVGWLLVVVVLYKYSRNGGGGGDDVGGRMGAEAAATTTCIKTKQETETIIQHKVEVVNQNDKRDDDDDGTSIYYNLSCPFEMSKYSCVFQDQSLRAKASRAIVQDEWMELRNELRQRGQVLPPGMRLILKGDSLMRQVHIAMGCLLHSAGLIKDYHMEWQSKPWHCPQPKCRSTGNHSSIVSSTLFLHTNTRANANANEKEEAAARARARPRPRPRPRAPEIHVFHNPPRVATPWMQQLQENGTITFPDPVHQLTDQDILLVSTGVHSFGPDKLKPYYNASAGMSVMSSAYDLMARFGREIQKQRQQQQQKQEQQQQPGLPRLWYMTTPSQHFSSKDGTYMGTKSVLPDELGTRQCLNEIQRNTRRDQEMKALLLPVQVDDDDDKHDSAAAAAAVDRILDFGGWDKKFGYYHVALPGDCSHYCMPGVLDLFVLRIVRALLEDFGTRDTGSTNRF